MDQQTLDEIEQLTKPQNNISDLTRDLRATLLNLTTTEEDINKITKIHEPVFFESEEQAFNELQYLHDAMCQVTILRRAMLSRFKKFNVANIYLEHCPTYRLFWDLYHS